LTIANAAGEDAVISPAIGWLRRKSVLIVALLTYEALRQ
jgi:hypothetical protein